MIQDELPCAWRFVDNTDKLTKNHPCSECDQEEFAIKSDPTLLPPFIWRGSVFYTPQSFWLRSLDGSADVNLSTYLSDLITFSIGSYVYIAYKGGAFPVIGSPLSTGKFQCEVSDGLNTIYSEPIHICDDLTHCIRMVWTNTCDVAGIPYVYLANLGGAFINILNIEKAPILQSEFETEKEESVNLLRQRTVLYQSQERVMRFKTIGPAWLVKVLKAMELHDNRDINVAYDSDTAGYVYFSNDVQDFEVITSDLENSECIQEMEIKFKQDDAIISGICCVNESPEACLTSCFTVQGFWPKVPECTEGAYYIDDVDSGIIVRCVGGVKTIVSITCVYVLNDLDDNYYYYNGDFWVITPELNFVSFSYPSPTTIKINIDGFMIPGTWGYVYYSCDNITFTQYPIPITAEELADGSNIVIPRCLDTYYLYITSLNHNCQYDDSDTISFTPE